MRSRTSKGKLLLLFAAIGCYTAVYLVFRHSLTVAVLAFAFLPVLTAGWLYGLGAGLTAAAVALVLNLLFFGLDPAKGWKQLLDAEDILGLAALLATGVLSGRLGELKGRLEATIRQQESLEESLKKSERKLRQVLEAAPVLIYQVRANRKKTFLVWVSDNVRQISGYGSAEVLEPHWWKNHIHPDDRRRTVVGLSRLFKRKRLSQEYRLKKKDGTYAWIREELRFQPEGAESPESGNITGVMLDISERRHLEAQLQHVQKIETVGTMSGGIAHDINNILTIIGACASHLKEAVPPDPETAESIKEIIDSVGRAAEVTRNLLIFSRKKPPELRNIELASAIRTAFDLTKRLVPETIGLEFPSADGRLTVLADPVQIGQVVVNLVTNARDAIPGTGTIRLSLEETESQGKPTKLQEYLPPGHYALLRVSDTGKGIAPEVLPRIFDPFFTTKLKGTGLGLSIVYDIVRRHGGHVDVETVIGGGTTFFVYFPLKGKIPASDKPSQAAQAGSAGSETILIAEDDPGVRKICRQTLERRGYAVITAEDGEEALEVVRTREGRIDLILLDLVLPKKSGREVYQAVRSAHPRIKILLQSGYPDTADVAQGLGGVELLQKPLPPEELLARVRRKLDEK